MCPPKHSVEGNPCTSTTITSRILVVKDDEEEVDVSMLRLFARYYTINAVAGPVSASTLSEAYLCSHDELVRMDL
jgi:hypothetical protein